MKRIIVFLCIIACFLLGFSLIAYAHSGGTDSAGGHYNHSTGEYHYHHGHPAHQHPDGVCPYGDYGAVETKINSEKKNDIAHNKVWIFAATAFFSLLLGYSIAMVGAVFYYQIKLPRSEFRKWYIDPLRPPIQIKIAIIICSILCFLYFIRINL